LFGAIVHKTAKPLQRDCKGNCKALKSYSLNNLINFLFLFLQFCSEKEIYRIVERCSAKIVPIFGGLSWRYSFAENCKTEKIH
jgi:hypothetical protein